MNTPYTLNEELQKAHEALSQCPPAISIYGSARLPEDSPEYQFTQELAHKLSNLGYTILAGGGPSIMKAANLGAFSGSSPSVGLNIVLPKEQHPNPYQNISLKFNYFYSRKAAFLQYSQAHIVMAGGIGTLDELFECFVHVQTKKMKPCPIILVGREFWQGLIQWLQDQVVRKKLIQPNDLNQLTLCDDMDEIIQIIQNHTQNQK